MLFHGFLRVCWYMITNKSNLIITTEMSVVFVYYAHKVVIVYTFFVICTYLHMYRCKIPVQLLYQKHQQYTGHCETLFHISWREGVHSSC